MVEKENEQRGKKQIRNVTGAGSFRASLKPSPFTVGVCACVRVCMCACVGVRALVLVLVLAHVGWAFSVVGD